MKAIRVHIENGKITGDAPPDLPDGDIDLRLSEPEDDFDESGLRRLNEALASGLEAVRSGRFRPAANVIADLRRR